jgi:hypothetical protein
VTSTVTLVAPTCPSPPLRENPVRPFLFPLFLSHDLPLCSHIVLMAIKDIAVSSGSACTSASLEPSYVLRALGAEEEAAHSSIRFGIGRFTTEEEVDFVVDKVVASVIRESLPLFSFKEHLFAFSRGGGIGDARQSSLQRPRIAADALTMQDFASFHPCGTFCKKGSI